MLWWMLRVDNWLDVAPLENMEEDYSFLFLKKNLMKTSFFLKNLKILNFWRNLKEFDWWFFFLKNLEILNFWRNLEIFIGDFSFGIWFWRFFLWKMKNFPFENGDFFFNFLLFLFFLWSQSEEDEDGLEMMKIY